jgi:D-serine deaminase-like pyridoxal phosphate-dependent protein
VRVGVAVAVGVEVAVGVAVAVAVGVGVGVGDDPVKTPQPLEAVARTSSRNGRKRMQGGSRAIVAESGTEAAARWRAPSPIRHGRGASAAGVGLL